MLRGENAAAARTTCECGGQGQPVSAERPRRPAAVPVPPKALEHHGLIVLDFCGGYLCVGCCRWKGKTSGETLNRWLQRPPTTPPATTPSP